MERPGARAPAAWPFHVWLPLLAQLRASLEFTSQTIKEIATEVGFGTLKTMHRVFKRALGVTPAEYRRRFSARAA